MSVSQRSTTLTVDYIDDIGYKMGGRFGKELLAACATMCELPCRIKADLRLCSYLWVRYALHLDRLQCTLRTWSMYRRLCGRFRNLGLCCCQHQDP